MSNLSGATTAAFTISLSAALETPVAVSWNTKDGTAKAGADYQAASGTVTFEPGETAKQIQVVVFGREDGGTETRTFSIELYPPENAILDQTLTEIEIQVTDGEGVAVASLVVATGPRGLKGDPGLSAYELAKLHGFEGTLQEWLEIQNPSAEMLKKAEEAANSAEEAASSAGEAKAARDQTQQIINDAGEQSTLVVLGSVDLPGAIKVALKYSGNVADALSEIYVDALGEFNNLQDGCSEAITARIKLITNMVNSAYVNGQRSFISVVFGHGRYALKDQTLFTGVKFKGQGRGATMIYPHADATWAFTVEGTAPFALNGTRKWQRLMYSGIEDLTIGEFWEDQGNVPEGAGGVNLQYSSYVKLSDVAFRRIKGCAINGVELFDSNFDNVSVMYCGNIITTIDDDTGEEITTIVHSVNFDKQGSDDQSNAIILNRFHMEANYTGMRLHICRHINFISPKFERDDTSHLIEGCQGVIFTSANMTWNREDAPQFEIYGVSGVGSENSDGDGVKFIAPDMRSSNKIGWYINANSGAGPTELVSPKARGISKMITGNNWTILGGDAYDCGPQLIRGGNNVFIDRFICRAMKPTVIGDGSDDAIIITGVNCAIRNSYLASLPGSATDGGAFINTTAATDPIVTENTVGGYRQYGIRGAISNDIRDNKIDRANNHVGSLTNQSSQKYTLTNANNRGLGVGSINSGVYTIAAGTSLSPDLVAGCSKFLIRVIVNGVASSAEFLADSSIAGLGAGPILGTLISFAAGTAGDGLVHVTKPSTGGSVTINNNTANSATVVILAITAHG